MCNTFTTVKFMCTIFFGVFFFSAEKQTLGDTSCLIYQFSLSFRYLFLSKTPQMKIFFHTAPKIFEVWGALQLVAVIQLRCGQIVLCV